MIINHPAPPSRRKTKTKKRKTKNKKSKQFKLDYQVAKQAQKKLDAKNETIAKIGKWSRTIFSLVIGIQTKNFIIKWTLVTTRKYPLHGYILGLGAPGTQGSTPKTYDGAAFISELRHLELLMG